MIIMKKITYLFTAFFLVALGWQGTAQNGGDDCASAVVISPGALQAQRLQIILRELITETLLGLVIHQEQMEL